MSSSDSDDQDSSTRSNSNSNSNSSDDNKQQDMRRTPTKERFLDEEEADNVGSSPAPTESMSSTPNSKASPQALSTTALGGGAAAAPAAATVSIEHRDRSPPSRICGMSPPMFVGILLLIGVLAYFLSQWLSIPGLDRQIERLEKEVDRLSTEVTRLEDQNDRFELLNGQLNNTVQELYNITDQLNGTANRLDLLNDELNATNLEFLERIDDLTEQNEEFARLNVDLNATAIELQDQVDRFQLAIATLILENSNLANYTDQLFNITGSLEDITMDQNATIKALELALNEFVQENEKLGNLNDDLVSVVSFLNETSIGIGDSLDAFTGFLAEQIAFNQLLVLDSLELNSGQKISNWDCDYRDVFQEKDYGNDFDLPIPATDIPLVIGYVNGRILNELCLSEVDYAKFLDDTYTSGELTSNRLVTSVTLYVTEALDWYFTTGVSSEQWEEAGFKCENLQEQFLYPDVNVI